MATLADWWTIVREELDTRSHKLVAEVAEAWNQVQTLTQMLAERLTEPDTATLRGADTGSIEKLFHDLAARLLAEPVSVCLRRRPLFTVLSAIRAYESGLDGVVQRLPVSVSVSGREIADQLGAGSGAGWRKYWLQWQRSSRELPLRAAVAGHLQRHILRRGPLDGAFQLALARACLHLLDPWQVLREEALKALSGARGPRLPESEHRRWAERSEEQARRMARLVEAYQRWADSAAGRLATALLRSRAEPSRRTRERRFERQQRLLSYWSRQQRAVQAVLELELALAALGADACRENGIVLASVQREYEQLCHESNLVLGWLETWELGKAEFPPPQVRLISAEEYAKDWEQRVLGHSRNRLPAHLEVVQPRRALPGRGAPWRQLQPQSLFSRVLAQRGVPTLIGGLREVVAAHQLLVREIERAREVVAFGEEVARTEGLPGHAVAREAVQNALALLEYQKKATPEVRSFAEAALVQAAAVVLSECHLALDKGRMGLLAHVTRQHGREVLLRSRELFLAGFRGASRKGWLLLRRLWEGLLVRIGWLAPPLPRLEPVSRRAHLGQVLDLQVYARDLPAIYRRLFRLTPIEEPRFLVGRETELAGLSEALDRWKSGGRSSAIVVGARGSGKTSLLNCAATGLFADLPVVRGQLSARVTTREGLHALLRNVLQLPNEADLADALSQRRRVVILEELERSFLRVINGFEALRELLTLIYQSSAGTLWIFSINETAFRYLDAVVGLGRHFSHRINAMSVRREDLIGAILQRHELSGLRLEFAPLPEEDPRLSRARRLLGLERDPERLFFDSLYRQSEGIFRSAFQLWQGSIDRVEGGVIHMRQPLVPDYRPLLAELDHEDHFILQAILQHGGLTVEEVAQATLLPAAESGRRLERLRRLEILESEPDCPGLRVRPEAGRFVREALHQQNLW